MGSVPGCTASLAETCNNTWNGFLNLRFLERMRTPRGLPRCIFAE